MAGVVKQMGVSVKACGCLVLALLFANGFACRPAQRAISTEAGATPSSARSGTTDLRIPLEDTKPAGSSTATPAGMVINRPMYTLTYPVGWKLDEKDEGFDLDNYFSIDAPGNCHVSFFLDTSKMDEKTYLDTQNATMKERVFKTDPAAVPFATWGTLAGSGVELRGKMKPVGKGHVRNFIHAEANRSVFVNEFCLDEDLPAAQAGFDLISKTFQFR